MGINAQFDATQFTPQQGFATHPAGVFDATISNTMTKPVKDNPNAGMFVVEFTTQGGRIEHRYNLWNPNQQAVDIAQKELSALCYATGVFRLDFNNDGAALRGTRCKIDVQPQKDKQGQPNGYMEVFKVLDLQGNEPGRTPSPAPAPQQASGQPLQQQPNGGWGNPQPQQPQPAPNPAPSPAPAPQGGGWGQPQPSANPPANPNAPPWAK